MIERVTVAYDGGPASKAALAWVIDRAQNVDMRVEIVAVGLNAELPLGVEADFRTPLEDALEHAKRTLTTARPGVVTTTRIRQGMPYQELVNASLDADLLVIGTNKTSPIAGVVHGTLPLKIAGRADCITVVVPANWLPKPGKVVAGWSDDATADAALDFAAAEASRRKAGLTIVHTWSVPTVAPMETAIPPVVMDELAAANRKLLADAAHRIRLAFPDITVTQGLHSGSAAVAIVGAASNASLVVVGSRGHGVIADFFLGSVSHDVLMNMPAPVAVVPQEKEPVGVYPDLVDDDI